LRKNLFITRETRRSLSRHATTAIQHGVRRRKSDGLTAEIHEGAFSYASKASPLRREEFSASACQDMPDGTLVEDGAFTAVASNDAWQSALQNQLGRFSIQMTRPEGIGERVKLFQSRLEHRFPFPRENCWTHCRRALDSDVSPLRRARALGRPVASWRVGIQPRFLASAESGLRESSSGPCVPWLQRSRSRDFRAPRAKLLAPPGRLCPNRGL